MDIIRYDQFRQNHLTYNLVSAIIDSVKDAENSLRSIRDIIIDDPGCSIVYGVNSIDFPAFYKRKECFFKCVINFTDEFRSYMEEVTASSRIQNESLSSEYFPEELILRQHGDIVYACDIIIQYLTSPDYIPYNGSEHFNKLRVVYEATGTGLADFYGNFIIDPFYDDIHWMPSESIAIATKNGASVIYAADGRRIGRDTYELVLEPSEGVICVRLNQKYGYIDYTGKYLIKPRYQDAFSFRNGCARVKHRGEYYLIDMRGNFICRI